VLFPFRRRGDDGILDGAGAGKGVPASACCWAPDGLPLRTHATERQLRPLSAPSSSAAARRRLPVSSLERRRRPMGQEAQSPGAGRGAAKLQAVVR